MNEEGLTSIFVVDRERRYQGILLIDDVKDMLDDNARDVKKYCRQVPEIDPQTTIDELFARLADLDTPLPVVGEEQKLIGVIVKTNIIANLASEPDEQVKD